MSNPPQQAPIGALVVPVTPLQQNCTLVWCTATNEAAFIDPGGEVDGLVRLVNRAVPGTMALRYRRFTERFRRHG